MFSHGLLSDRLASGPTSLMLEASEIASSSERLTLGRAAMSSEEVANELIAAIARLQAERNKLQELGGFFFSAGRHRNHGLATMVAIRLGVALAI